MGCSGGKPTIEETSEKPTKILTPTTVVDKKPSKINQTAEVQPEKKHSDKPKLWEVEDASKFIEAALKQFNETHIKTKPKEGNKYYRADQEYRNSAQLLQKIF